MFARPFAAGRRFFVPEVVQTSAMDCGPAALKALLEGFGISASYGRLREACQTDVDGTSIDTLEEVALQLGLVAEQVMVPTDHLLLDDTQTLPAIVIVRLPNGLTHFVVLWNQVGPFVQVMDPASGRRWPSRQRLLQELYLHSHPIPAAVWRDWAGSAGFCDPLQQRLQQIVGKPADTAQATLEQLLEQALDDASWHTLATLDATTRMVEALIEAGGLVRGPEALHILERFFQRACQEPPGQSTTIPDIYWLVKPAVAETDEELVFFRGAVLIRVTGRSTAQPPPETETDAAEAVADTPLPLSPELVAALEEPPSRPGLEIWKLLRADGLLTPGLIVIALLLSAGAVIIQALLLRGLIDLGQNLSLVGQRVGAVTALVIFFVALFLIEFPLISMVLRMGRRLESRFRIRFLEKIPRLSDRYFQSRLTSDMTQRLHSMRQIRSLPNLALNFLRVGFQLIFTAIGLIVLHPSSAPLTLLATAFAISMAFITQPIFIERDLRLRTHLGALSRFYLDALIGLIPIRTHGAERAIRREHESLLVEWLRAGDEFYQVEVVAKAIETLVGLLFLVLILFSYIVSGGSAGGMLLQFYWALSLPALGRVLASIAQQYPLQRNQVLRLIEPIQAPEDTDQPDGAPPEPSAPPTTSAAAPAPPTQETPSSAGFAIVMQDVTVVVSGHTILNDLQLDIQPAEHIAIIGPSGAGKSSFVGLLLGWHRPAQGQVLVDGQPLRGAHLHALRRQMVWVDPAVQLWNRSLLENIRYGNQTSTAHQNGLPVEAADLFQVLERLPNGLQTILGEGGGLVSGGEGQRVRLARAMFRDEVRLVILDEPFRGLDRTRRQVLLQRARQYWRNATLLFISHDVGESRTFDRVLVIENGLIVEDEAPQTLMTRPHSRYQALLQAEEQVRTGMWSDALWRRLWLADGRLRENRDL